MGRVEGKAAIVSGGAGGIGAATCRRLASEGAHVTVTDITDEAGEKLAAEIGGAYVHHDVTDPAAWEEIVAGVEAAQGGLHILVNAAGIEGDMAAGDPEHVTPEEWRRVMSINLDGTFYGCRTAIPAMRRAGGGSIVNISSIIARMAAPATAAYGASKAGVMHLAKTVAHHGAKDRIRCNSVHPGLIDTRMLRNIFETRSRKQNLGQDEVRAKSLERVPMGELGQPEDVAWMILYLASDEARYVTGAHFDVDGGWNLN